MNRTLREGLTVEGKPLKDFLDARNHAEAIDLLAALIQQERPITVGLIKEINALLLRGVDSTPARDAAGRRVKKPAAPGAFKTQPNHVLQADGRIHCDVEPVQVAPEMEALMRWIDDVKGQQDPIITAAIAHYNFVRIHPFDDGNGRGARILMNLILLQADPVPAVLRAEQRRSYIDALQAADDGDLQPFILFVSNACHETVKSVMDDLKRDLKED